MEESDSRDAAAILRRRAAFIASALSGLTLTQRVEAQAAPGPTEQAQPAAEPCPFSREPRELDKDEARTRFQASVELFASGQFEQASAEARRAYALYPRENIALAALDADLARGAAAEAFVLAEQHQRCVGESTEVARRLEQARLATGLVRFRWSPSSATVELDGKSIEAERAKHGVRVAPGQHVAVLRGAGEPAETKITVDLGAEVTVELRAPVTMFPMPCLSPPPPREPEASLRLQAGVVAPLAVLHVAAPIEFSLGPGLFEEVSGQAATDLWLEANLFQCVTLTEDVAYGFLGGGVDVQYRVTGPTSIGLGFSGGALLSPAASTRAAGFFGPVLIPLSLALDPFFLELRVPLWFTPVVGFEPKVEFGMVAPQIVIGVGGVVVSKADDWEGGVARR
jgi:hypothetical protein